MGRRYDLSGEEPVGVAVTVGRRKGHVRRNGAVVFVAIVCSVAFLALVDAASGGAGTAPLGGLPAGARLDYAYDPPTRLPTLNPSFVTQALGGPIPSGGTDAPIGSSAPTGTSRAPGIGVLAGATTDL